MSSKAKVAKKPAAAKRKGAKGYKFPDPIPNGEILQDISKKKWRIGPSVGTGGFGEIYSACEHDSTPKKTSLYPYVIKIEPHGNGPLFVEMHFYMRNAKKEDVQGFMKANKMAVLGMPLYMGSGSHECNGEKYRFVVMERYGKDLWARFLESGRRFPAHTVFRIAIQMIDVLQYIHGRTYVHADIKGGNILFGTTKSTENQAYLVDFGLASHYTIKEYKFDPKRAHNGTIEYTSIDAHHGVATRRGDMEILGYNLVQWLAGRLPWEGDLSSPPHVQQQKEKLMKDIPAFMKKAFPTQAPPHALVSYLQYVSKMEYDETPDYNKCRQMFAAGLKALGYSNSCNLDFTPTRPKSPKRSLVVEDDDQESESENLLAPKRSKVVKKRTLKAKKSLSPKKDAVAKKTVVKRSLKADSEVKSTPDCKQTTTIATQTSLEKPKLTRSIKKEPETSFSDDSVQRPRRNGTVKNYLDSSQSSPDVIDNSLTETPPKKSAIKRKHTKRLEVEYASDEEVTIHTTIKKKGTPVKCAVRSWKNSPAIVNGKVSSKV